MFMDVLSSQIASVVNIFLLQQTRHTLIFNQIIGSTFRNDHNFLEFPL